MLYQTDSFTQAQDRQFAAMADVLTDAAKAKALIAYLDAKFGNPACGLCCAPLAVGVGSDICSRCQGVWGKDANAAEVIARTMPGDFAAAVADYDANGLRYVTPGTFQAVYNEAVGA